MKKVNSKSLVNNKLRRKSNLKLDPNDKILNSLYSSSLIKMINKSPIKQDSISPVNRTINFTENIPGNPGGANLSYTNRDERLNKSGYLCTNKTRLRPMKRLKDERVKHTS